MDVGVDQPSDAADPEAEEKKSTTSRSLRIISSWLLYLQRLLHYRSFRPSRASTCGLQHHLAHLTSASVEGMN